MHNKSDTYDLYMSHLAFKFLVLQNVSMFIKVVTKAAFFDPKKSIKTVIFINIIM